MVAVGLSCFCPAARSNQTPVAATFIEHKTTFGHGIRPSKPITLVEPSAQEGEPTKHYVIDAVAVTDAPLVKTITPGKLDVTEIPEREPGQPDEWWVIKGGATTSRETITRTTTIEGLPRPTKDLLIPGPEPAPGGAEVVIEIPAASKEIGQPEGWNCPCNSEPNILTVTHEPAPRETIEIKGSDGNVTTAPTSKFPCSKDDKNPCRGKLAQGWTDFSVVWDASYPRPGPPAPYKTSSNFDYDTILTLTDDIYQAEHFTITMDGEKIGETYEDGWKNDKLYCGKDADGCIAKGFSHGSFLIPGGKHDLSFQWTDGKYATDAGWNWWYGAGQYRFDRPCECGEKSEL